MVAVLKEFYANAPDKSPFFTFVQDKMVSFTVQEINDYYNLQSPAIFEYMAYKDHGLNYEQILSELCKPKSSWSSKGTYFPSKDLSRH